MAENTQEKKKTYKEKQREEIEAALSSLYKKKTENTKHPTLTELGNMLGMSQSTVSRVLNGYMIDWADEWKIKPKKEQPKSELAELAQALTITRPSTFFINIAQSKRKRLKETLLKYFSSSSEQYGIIHIIETSKPSGLLVFSDDHNLEHYLTDLDYLKQLEDNAKNNH